jgi:hypothetical protein
LNSVLVGSDMAFLPSASVTQGSTHAQSEQQQQHMQEAAHTRKALSRMHEQLHTVYFEHLREAFTELAVKLQSQQNRILCQPTCNR